MDRSFFVICLQIVCIQLICLLFCFCFNNRSILKLCVSPDPRAPLALKSNNFLCPHLLTLHLPIQLPYQQFLQNERNFLQEELSRVEVELAQLTNAGTGNTSSEKTYLVYDVRPMRLVIACSRN